MQASGNQQRSVRVGESLTKDRKSSAAASDGLVDMVRTVQVRMKGTATCEQLRRPVCSRTCRSGLGMEALIGCGGCKSWCGVVTGSRLLARGRGRLPRMIGWAGTGARVGRQEHQNSENQNSFDVTGRARVLRASFRPPVRPPASPSHSQHPLGLQPLCGPSLGRATHRSSLPCAVRSVRPCTDAAPAPCCKRRALP